MLKKIFNGVEYKIETIEDYLTYMEIKNMAGYKRKEVKKVKKEIDLKKIPYFEVKVVKVKGKKKEIRSVKCSICGNTYAPCTCATVTKHKGNWVNGENLDKIKFPVPCSWNIPLDKDINYGLLIKITNDLYTLYNINLLTYALLL